MNKFVKEHYPVESLPPDLRPDLPPGSSVTVVISAEENMQQPLSGKQAAALIKSIQLQHRGKGVSPEEAAAEIRQMRDEWDD